MPKRIQLSGLSINRALHDLIAKEITPGSGVGAAGLRRRGFGGDCRGLGGKNRALLEKRDWLQKKINA